VSRALIVTPEAEADILDGFRSYEEKQPGLGTRFLGEIEQSLNRIAPNPYQYEEVEPDIRRAVVHVLAVIHGSQGPADIKARLGA
jgi:plasmid stabilization system protein ParE